MANGKEIQVDDGGFARIHNAILEALAKARLSGAEFRCVMFLFRKTYGWGKKEDTISLSQWGEGTDAKRHHVMASLNTLVEKKIIYRRLDKGQTPTYGFNKYVEEWEGIEADSKRGERFHKDEEVLPEQVTVTSIGNTPVTKAGNGTVTKTGTHKRKKENIKDNLGGGSSGLGKQINELISAFSEAANIPCINSDRSKWSKEAKMQIERGLTPDDIREAVKKMRSGKDSLTVSWLGSVTKVAVAIKSERGQPRGATRILTGPNGEQIEVPA